VSDATSPDSTMPTGTAEPAEMTEETRTTGTTARAEALAARVRVIDAEVRAIEAEALALAADADVPPPEGGVSDASAPGPDSMATAGASADSASPSAIAVAAAAESPAASASASDQTLIAGDGLQRREFVRRLTSDAVVMAGKFYSLSRVITRSATAAGQAVIADLESIRRDQGPEGATGAEAAGSGGPAVAGAPTQTQAAIEEAPAASVAVAGPAAAVVTAVEPPTPPAPPAPVPLNLTPEQESLFERVRVATLGVNRVGLSPHLTPAQFHWDGLVIRIPSLGWASRTTNIRREPHATLFVEDPETGEFGAISGMTTIVERRSSVREQNDGLLRRYYPGVDADEQWTKLLAEDPDRVLLVLQPVQTIWGRRA